MPMRPIFNDFLYCDPDGQPVHRIGLSGDSDDPRPTPQELGFRIAGSSFILDNDNGQVSTWSEKAQDWVPQFTIQQE